MNDKNNSSGKIIIQLIYAYYRSEYTVKLLDLFVVTVVDTILLSKEDLTEFFCFNNDTYKSLCY